MSQLRDCFYLSHMRAVKARERLHICAVLPEPSLLAHPKYRGSFGPKFWPLTEYVCLKHNFRHLSSIIYD